MYEVVSGRVVGRAAAALLCAAVLLAGAFALPSPASAAVVPAPSALTVLAGDMVDVLAWTPPRTGVAASYRIESAPAESGPWTVVGKTTTPRYTDRLRTPALLYYRVVAIDRAGKASPPSLVVSNAQVAIESLVTATGATLRAANGALSLTLPAGTFSAPTRVRVTQPANAPAQRVGIAVTPAYDFYASAALAKPASVTMAYTIPVKHFQVAAGLAAAIELATFEAASSKWVPVPTTVDTAAGTLSAQMPHFSYWEGTIIQPHGTSPAKTSYCDGICHNLAVAPGSQTVLTTTDSQVCYNCHGSDGLSPTPAGATGANVQADVFACTGQTFDPVTQSRHPVPAPGTTAGLACTRCHDPHADPTASPNLLRAQDAVTGKAVASKAGLSPGNPFCWACHGTRKNASVDRAVAGYYTRTGDKKTAFQYTPHANGPQITRIFALPNDFGRGTLTGAEAPASGGLIPTEHENIALGKPYALSLPVSWETYAGDMTDADRSSCSSWIGSAEGEIVTVDIDVDLGETRSVRGAAALPMLDWPADSPDTMQVFTSIDGVTWASVAPARGTLGTMLDVFDTSFTPRAARYVRVRVAKRTGLYFENNQREGEEAAGLLALSLSEVEVYDNSLTGSFVSEDVLLSDEGTVTSSKVVWESDLSGGATARVWTDVSPDGGNTWVGETEAVNGGPLAGIPLGTELGQVQFRWRTELVRPTRTAALRLKAVSFTFGTSHDWSPATWPGSSAPKGSCANCHGSHGSANAPKLMPTQGDALCAECHDAATPNRPQLYSYRDAATYSDSAHGSQACDTCHPSHGSAPDGAGSASLLPKGDGSLCLTCHGGPLAVTGVDVAAAFAAAPGALAHHDAAPGAVSLTSTRLRCEDCHGPHATKSGSGLSDPDDPGTPMPVGRSVPATSVVRTYAEMDIPVIADTTLESENPSLNYGASAHVTVDPTKTGLVRADVDMLPSGVYVTSAELRMYAPVGDRADSIVPRTLTEPWGGTWQEGTGDGVENSMDVNGATWDERWFGNGDWNAPWQGPDPGPGYENMWGPCGWPYFPFSTSAFAAVAPGEPWVGLDVTTQISARYSRSGDNITDIVLMADSPGAYLRFDSRETANAPYVHVHYYRTTVPFEATADTAIWSTGDGNRNDGAAPGLSVSESSDGTSESRVLLKFDVSSIPANATITFARIMVFGTSGGIGDGTFAVRTITNEWLEGTGDDDPNSETVDGATWNESRWGVMWPGYGGDLGTEVARSVYDDKRFDTGRPQWIDLVGYDSEYGKGLVAALRDPETKGLVIVSGDQGSSPWLNFDSKDNVSGRGPVLEVQYSLAEPDDSVSSIEFCTKCHDDNTPGDIGSYPWTIAPSYTGDLRENYRFMDSHGYALAKGTASNGASDSTATMKPPYFYGMGPLQCTECHDPHGSSNAFHLRETINGVSGLKVLDPTSGTEPGNQQAWCGACHAQRSHWCRGRDCLSCHNHGTNTGRYF